jgi:hypothetical protein
MLENRIVPAVHDLTTSMTYATIQAAVTAANSGDIILADAGTYAENVTVTKSLTIEGAQHGVDARTRSGPESIVDGTTNGGKTPFYITASNVTIDGFTVQGATNMNQFGFGILLGAGTSGSRVLNDIVQNNIAGIGLANNSTSQQTVIQRNLINNNNQPGAASGAGIYSDQFVAGGTLQNVLIDSNSFTANTGDAGIDFSTTDATKPATNITISNNNFNANDRGLFALNLTNSLVTGNTLQGATDNATADIRLGEGDNGLQITGNLLKNGAGRVMRISNFGTGSGPATAITFAENSMSGYAGPSDLVSIDAGAYSGTLNASGNWWGAAIGANPSDATAPAAINGKTSGAVHVGSFLNNSANTATGTGFTPAAATEMWVPKTGATSGLVRVSGVIKDAINTALPGMPVRVAADTYSEGIITLTRTITLLGAQAGVDARSRGVVPETIVQNTEGDFQVEANNVTIDGFTLQGVTANPISDPASLGAAIWTNPGFSGTHGGHQILNNIIQGNIAGIELDNDGTYQTNVKFNLFKGNNQPGPNSGLDIEIDFGLSKALIDSNKFTNTSFVTDSWAMGIEAPSDHVTFSNNAVTNQGRGVFFYETNNVTISGNMITGASHFGIGIFGINGLPANSSFTISNNILSVNGSGGSGVEVVDDTTPGTAYSGTLTVSGDHYTTSGSDLSIRNESSTPIDATAETFNGVLASSATLAQQFTIVDTIVDGVDVSGFGLVRTKAGNVYVTRNSFFAPDFTTAPSIQRGINAAAAGDTVNVQAGTYAENVIINKAVNLRGAQAGANANTRFAAFVTGFNGPKANPAVETVLTAPTVNPTNGNPNANDLIRVVANNITIDGLVIDGNNPALAASPVKTGTINIDARRGIQNSDANNNFFDINNLILKNNIVQNVAQRGIELSNNTTVSSGNLITANVVRNFGSDPANGGHGIILFTNAYADVTNNTVVDTLGQIGIQLQNFFSTGSMTWSGNQVTVAQDGIGIIANLFYAPAGVLNIQNNTVKAAAGVTGTDDLTWGIYVLSVQVGSTVNLNTNTVGASGGQFARGINLWNLPTTNTVSVSGGSLANSLVGIDLDSVDPFFGAGAATTVNVSGVVVTGGTTGFQARATTVAGVNPTASVTLNLNNVKVSGATTGVLVQGFSPTITATVSLTTSTLTHNATGLSVQNKGSLASATLNTFTQNTNDGLLIAANAGTIGTIMCNTFSGNIHAGLESQLASQVNAQRNFWGDPSGPTNAGNLGGIGDKVIGNVSFIPWATSSDCTLFSSSNSGSVTLVTDPCDPTQKALVIIGTNGNDDIDIRRVDDTNLIEVDIDSLTFDFHQTYNPSTLHIDRFIVYGLNGDDHITVDNNVTIDAWVFAGNGENHIKVGGGNNVVVGGSGENQIDGGIKRDLLIAGRGSAVINGHGGDDILIGGYTDYDHNLTALCAIMKEWTSTASYATRVGHLMHGGGMNGSFLLNTSTVHDNGAVDVLHGNEGMSLFFAKVHGTHQDEIDAETGETVVDIS